MKRFRGLGTFKGDVKYKFDENGDILFDSLIVRQSTPEVDEQIQVKEDRWKQFA